MRFFAILTLALSPLALMAMAPAPASARATADAIENISSILEAEKLCGFKVNQEVFGFTLTALGVKRSELEPGGVYDSELKANRDRMARLSSTPEKKASLCNTIKTNLSSMFD